jgi:hypothetical protein
MKFWKRVNKCKHINLHPNYFEWVDCQTPYCEGSETHCKDCGAYISECQCHSNDGISGWPQKRWRKHG